MNPFNRSRQLDIFRPEDAASPVTVIGAGGIGSPTVLALAKMGVPDITVYDFDTVDDVNLPSQLYRKEDLGRPKVEALADIVGRFTDCAIRPVPERYEGQPLDGAVIAAVDTMAGRKTIWERVRYDPGVELLVDARMGGQVLCILTARPCDPDDIELYEEQLFTDEEAAPTPCTAQSIVYNTLGIASLLSAILRRWWVEGDAPRVIRGDFGTLSFM